MKTVALAAFALISFSLSVWADCVRTTKLRDEFLSYKIVGETEEQSQARSKRFRNAVWPVLTHFKANQGSKEFQCVVGLAAAAENWDPDNYAAGLIGRRLDETGFEEAFERGIDTLDNRCRAKDFRKTVSLKICLGPSADSEKVAKCSQQFAEEEPLEDCERIQATQPKKIPEKVVKAIKKQVDQADDKKPSRDRRPAGVNYTPIYIDPNNLPE
jgi:hypothetical protein